MAIHLERVIPGAPEKVYALLTNGAKLGEITGRPGKGGGMDRRRRARECARPVRLAPLAF